VAAAAAIDASGLAEGTSVGDASITASWMNISWIDTGQGCWMSEYPGQDSAPLIVAQEITFVNVTTDVNSNNTTFTSGVGTPTATVTLTNPSHPVCFSPNRSGFHINVHFRMPPYTDLILTDSTNTYVTDSGTLWKSLSRRFENISYSSLTGTMVIGIIQDNLNEFEDKDYIIIRIAGRVSNGNRISGVGKVKFRCS